MLCRKYGIKCEDKWFNHVPSTVCSNDNGNIELFWNKEIYLGVAENRPDVIVVDKEQKKWTLIDFSVPCALCFSVSECFITASVMSSLKPLAQDVTKIFRCVYNFTRAYYRAKELQRAKSIATFDFSTLYTKIPYHQLIDCLTFQEPRNILTTIGL